ncbi:MAG TPA: DUF3108 domain-containing protein [Burkholderiaceae bacterium]|nr:DUF3108 domain-containing protein [Burkholderiaceae bacterium]
MAGFDTHQRLIGGIVLAVLLGHWAALAWLHSVWQDAPLLRPLATPMYTRLLAPAPAPPAPVPQKKTVPARAHRGLAAATPRASSEPPPQSAPIEAPTSSAPDAQPAAPPEEPARQEIIPAPESVTTTIAATPTLPDLWPADTQLSYALSGYYRGELHGDARVQWQRQGERYQVRIEVDIGLLASLSMTSQGDVTREGLVPRAYEELVRGRRRGAVLGEQNITLDNGAKVPRPDGVQDTASQFVALTHQFTSGRATLEVGRQVRFWMARPGGVDQWSYDMTEEVILQTPRLGPVRAIHLKPRPIANPRGNIVAEMWFAPSLQNLPVRIRIRVGEDSFIDLLVDRIEQR